MCTDFLERNEAGIDEISKCPIVRRAIKKYNSAKKDLGNKPSSAKKRELKKVKARNKLLLEVQLSKCK